MIKQLSVLFLLLFTLTGCLKEDTEGCPTGKLSISLKYTINVDGEDLLDEKVGQINLYVFNDATGLLVRVINISHEQLVRGAYFTDLDPGSYTFVAWAVNGQDLSQGGYEVVDVIDYATDTYTTPKVGTTKIDNFRVRLKTTTSGENKIPSNESFNELYHAKASNIIVSEGEQTINFDFTKNTNEIKVRVEGLEHLVSTQRSISEVEIFVIGTEDRYDIYNTTGKPTTTPLRYQRAITYPEKNVAQSDIHILKLDMELHKTNPILLYLLRNDTKEQLVKPINLLDLILKTKDKNGELIFKTQQDLDRWDKFPVVIKIAFDLSVTVGIDGFEIEDTEGEL